MVVIVDAALCGIFDQRPRKLLFYSVSDDRRTININLIIYLSPDTVQALKQILSLQLHDKHSIGDKSTVDKIPHKIQMPVTLHQYNPCIEALAFTNHVFLHVIHEIILSIVQLVSCVVILIGIIGVKQLLRVI